MIQPRGFLGRVLDPLLKARLPLMKNVLQPLTKSVLILLGSTAAASAADKKVWSSGTTALIILHEEMEDIMKIVKSLEHSGLLIKGVSETIQSETK